jgi:hypothetical protein
MQLKLVAERRLHPGKQLMRGTKGPAGMPRSRFFVLSLRPFLDAGQLESSKPQACCSSSKARKPPSRAEPSARCLTIRHHRGMAAARHAVLAHEIRFEKDQVWKMIDEYRQFSADRPSGDAERSKFNCRAYA